MFVFKLRVNSSNDINAYSLCFPFVRSLVLMVNSTEIGHNYRYGQGDYEYTTEGTYATDDFAGNSFRYHVTISEKRFV